jgi:apolipoprotein N-acyltransferase
MKQTVYTIAALGLLALSVAIIRMIALPLWGYWPLVLGIGFIMVLTPIIHLRTGGFWQIMSGGIAGCLFGLSFYEGPLPILSFGCFIPLLFLVEYYIEQKKSLWGLWGLLIWSFLLANVIATFWVMNTALAAGIFANVVNAFLMSLPLMGFAIGRRHLKSRYFGIAFAALWLLFEFFHFNWDLHWPWLTLGYALSEWTWAIQWYDVTGVLGGSLWILLVNWFLFLSLSEKRDRRSNLVAALLFGLLPLGLSWAKMPDTKSREEPVEILIVQPNFEPHYEKFEVTEKEQLERISQLANKSLQAPIDLLVLPETVFTIRLNNKEKEPVFKQIREWQQRFPNVKVISGFASQRVLPDSEASTRFTRTSQWANGKTLRWEAGNIAYYFGGTSDTLYYKSKLVPGAEFFPYYNLLFVFENIARSLGGSLEGFRTQQNAQVFGKDPAMAPIICYESIFGDYCRQYVALGADIFVIMTNDGWWDNTPGHRQHLRYAQVRAIEHRRPIARAANTGISAFIEIDGKIRKKLPYGKEGVLQAAITPNDKITFYSRWGDLIGRISLFVVIVLLMQLLYQIFADRRDRAQGIDSRTE